MSSTRRSLLLTFAAIGLLASAVSTYVHYGLLTQPGFTSFCDVNATVSCTQAYLSRFGSFRGVPVALGGLVFFGAVLMLAGVAAKPTSSARDSAPGYIFALSTLGLAFVLYLAYASFFILNTFCILCAITYVSVIAVFIISGGASALPMTTLPGRAGRDLRALVSSPSGLAMVALFVAGAATLIAVFPRETAAGPAASSGAPSYPPVTADERAKLAQWWEVQERVDLGVNPDGAKVVVVKFNDYQCPPCRITHQIYKSILDKHAATGDLKYVLKHFPLEPECNAFAPGGIHYGACEAAAGVIMAKSKGTAAKLEEWLFANQGPPTLTSAQVKDAIRDVGGVSDFDAQYAAALQEIRSDAALGSKLQVGSTPTFFINGRRMGQALAPQYFEVLIELELDRTR